MKQERTRFMNQERLVAIHRRRNEEARGSSAAEAGEHRTRVAAMLAKIPENRRDSIAFLGAGNCSELDLPELAARFERIDLYDLDRAAVDSALRSQFPLGTPGHLAAIEFEATGLPPLFTSSGTVAAEEIAKTLARTIDLPNRPAQGYSAVVSLCLLSQLVEILAETLHPPANEMAAWATLIRKQHVQLLLQNVASGGSVILITDFVSERTLPEIGSASTNELAPLAQRALGAGNFFAGLHPGAIREELQETGPCEGISEPSLWVWRFGPRRFLVAGFEAKKK